jgi:hypothetical protein
MNVNDSVWLPAATMSSNDLGRNDHCSEAILRVQKEDGLWLMSN